MRATWDMLSAKEHLWIRESFTQEVSVKRSQGLMNKHLVGEEKKPAFQGEGRLHCKGWKQIVSGNGEIVLYGCSVHQGRLELKR